MVKIKALLHTWLYKHNHRHNHRYTTQEKGYTTTTQALWFPQQYKPYSCYTYDNFASMTMSSSSILLLLLVIIISQSLPSSCAPSWNSNDAERSITEDDTTSYDIVDQQKLQKLLIDGIFKKESNIAVIRRTFRSNTSKICTPISYEVNYGTSDDTYCSDINNPFSFNWTRYNPNEKLMRIIVALVSLSSDIPVLGFDWDSICNFTVPDKTLNIDLHTNTCVANDDISQALGTITTLVSRNPYQRPAAKQLLMLWSISM